MKKDSMIKNIVFSILVMTLFFVGIEGIQRIRYFVRYKQLYWLCYGFMPKPLDYEDRQNKYIEKTITKSKEDILDIQIPVWQFDGYHKINPNYKWEGWEINSRGFRGKEIGKKEKYRIICLGGSTTFGVGSGNNETYPHYLQEITGCEVINCGIGAATIHNIRNMFEKEILPLKPDMIIINSVANNVYYKSFAYIREESKISHFNTILVDKILIYMTLREKLALVFNRSCSDLYKASLDTTVRCFMKDKEFWEDLKTTYMEIIKSAKDNNIDVVIVKQPIRLGGNTILFHKKMKVVYDYMFAMFDSFGVITIDVSLPSEVFSPDNLHLMPSGNKKLAKIIAEVLWKTHMLSL